jgi:hypothetical protein
MKCTVYPAPSLVLDGYRVQGRLLMPGRPQPKFADEIALRRMEKNGVTLTNTNQVIAELTGNGATPEGADRSGSGDARTSRVNTGGWGQAQCALARTSRCRDRDQNRTLGPVAKCAG